MRCVVVGLTAALLSPAALSGTALAQRAAVELEMQAGPGDRFPPVAKVARDDTLQVHGCVEGYRWCDVSRQEDRGWVPADQLEIRFEESDVRVSEYGPRLKLPVVGFAFSAYWDAFYSKQPWYGDRERWQGMWRDQPEYLRYGRAERGASAGSVASGGSLGSAQRPERDRGQGENFGARAESEGRNALQRSAETGVEPRGNREAGRGDGLRTGPDDAPGSVSVNQPTGGGEIHGSVGGSPVTTTPGNTSGPATGSTISGPTPGNPASGSTSGGGAGSASGSAGSSSGGAGSGGGGGGGGGSGS